MDDLLQHAHQLANQASTPIAQPIEGRVAYVVNEGHSASSGSIQQLAEALNQSDLEIICMVRPGWPWDTKEASSPHITPETNINGVRYLHSPLPNNVLGGDERASLEASVEQLSKLLRIYRPAAVLAEIAGVGLAAWIATKRLGLAFYGVEASQGEVGKTVEPLNLFVAQHAMHLFTISEQFKEALVTSGVSEKSIDNVVNKNGTYRISLISNEQKRIKLKNNEDEVLNKSKSLSIKDDQQKKINTLPKEGVVEKGAFQLTEEINWKQFDLNGDNVVRVQGTVDVKNGSNKSSVVLVELFDENNKRIPPDEIDLPQSEVFGGSFIYLQDTKNKKVQWLSLETSKDVFCIKLGFVLFMSEEGTSVEVRDFEVKSSKLHVSVIEEKEGRLKKPSDFKVAIIADEFTYNSFSQEFVPLPIEPSNWLDIFQKEKPDLFFCESAWSGVDSAKRPWKGSIYTSTNFRSENRKVLFSILSYCKKAGIPTVFWNKEDPTHHNDRVHDFVDTAKKFDYVFTTASECVDSYKLNHGVKNVYSLPFATNPRLFNPIEESERSNDVVFAGSWYANHEHRSKVMENILDKLLSDGFSLKLYDRFYESEDELHEWPKRYQSYLLPSKPHNEIPYVYKSSVYGLNFNTVTDSPTMFARRVFELMSSNTLVLSNWSKGMQDIFGELVVFPDIEPTRLKELSKEKIDEIRYRALHEVLEHHTYKSRWKNILRTVGVRFYDDDVTVTFVSVISSCESADSAITWFQQHGIQSKNSKLLLVADDLMDPLAVASIYQKYNQYGVAVTSCHHAKKYAIADHYSPIETSHFVTLTKEVMENPCRVKEAMLHFQYMRSFPLALESNFDNKYKVRKVKSSSSLLDHASKFTSWLCFYRSSSSLDAYLV